MQTKVRSFFQGGFSYERRPAHDGAVNTHEGASETRVCRGNTRNQPGPDAGERLLRCVIFKDFRRRCFQSAPLALTVPRGIRSVGPARGGVTGTLAFAPRLLRSEGAVAFLIVSRFS